MADFKVLTVDNSKKAAVPQGKKKSNWKNPGAAFYDQLLNAVSCKGKMPEGPDDLKEAIKDGRYMQWDKLLKEAYMVAPVENIKNSPHGVTPFARSGCKYPHHVIKGDKLVVSIDGLRAAYICARNQGVLVNHTPENKQIVAHFNRHFKELGLKPVWHHGEFYLMTESDVKIEQNFNDIYGFILERTGVNLFDPFRDTDKPLTESHRVPLRLPVFANPSDAIPSLITEEADWISRFANDEVFRESAGISTMRELLNTCKTPEELVKWMDCIQYGWIDSSGKIRGTGDDEDENDFFKEYRLQVAHELIKSKVGVCWDQTELERQWFFQYKEPDHSLRDSREVPVPFIVLYLEINDGEACPTHTTLIYKHPGEDMRVFWFEHAWGNYKGIHEYKDFEECLEDIIEKFQASHNDTTSPLILRNVGLPDKWRDCRTCDEYMQLCRNSREVDRGDILYDDIFNESVEEMTPDFGETPINEGVVPHTSYTFDTLPNELYFSSPFKLKELKGQVFMSPYAGISSIFLVDRFNVCRECFADELGHPIKKSSYNVGYKEWSMEVEDLDKPLKIVHMHHNVPECTKKYNGSASGYIYKVDISDVRDKLHKHGNHSLDYEVIYRGDKPLKILEVKPHTIKWELEFSETNMKNAGRGFVESADIFDPEGLHWSSRMLYTEAEEEPEVEDQAIGDDPPPSLGDIGEEPAAEDPAPEEDGPKEGDELDAPIPEPVEEPTEEAPAEEAPAEEQPAEEAPKPEPKKESMPKRADREESDKNGVRRKKLYIAFIEWCKEYNNKNAFGSIFDKDAFKVSYPFVPDEMRYFYRLANPMLCILSGNLTFFPVAELRKINAQNKKYEELLIFAGTEKDFRVFNTKDKAVYLGTEEGGEVKLGSKLADSFDLYIQTMIGKGDILNGPIEESTEFDYE